MVAWLSFKMVLVGPPEWDGGMARAAFYITVFTSTVVILLLTAFPFGFIVAFGEAVRMRSMSFYAVAGAELALVAGLGLGWVQNQPDPTDIYARMLPALLAAGGGAGFVHWLIAGRRAGASFEDR